MIHHVGLEVAPGDADAEVAFWTLLGFAEVAPPDARLAERSRWVERAGTQIHLLFADAPAAPAGAGHLAVVAEGFEETCAALREAGALVEERTAYWGERRAKTTSPAGHGVEIMAAPPPPTA